MLFTRLPTHLTNTLRTSSIHWVYCCDRKSRAAYAQSFALWQQATIEITRHDHSPRTLVVTLAFEPYCDGSDCLALLRSESPSGMCAELRTVAASNNKVHMPWSLYFCLFAPHMYGVVLHAHPVRGESHNQRNTTGEVATICTEDKRWPFRKSSGQLDFSYCC